MSTQVQFKDYSMGFKDDDGKVYNLIDHLNMQLDEGKALGIVGESGCGKSMTSLSLMRLLPAAASVQGGEILLNGEDLLKKSEPEMEKIRGKQIAMIFQEPMTALNPVMTIGKQIGECLKLHHPEMKEDEIRKQVCEALNDVGIANPETRIDQYPHEFSGGITNLANAVLYTRNSMIDVLHEDYIRTAYAKGNNKGRVLRVHALKNALIPTVTVIGMQIGFMVGGATVTETVFSWPGIGRMVYDAVNALDYPVLQGAFLVMAVAVVIMSFLTDLVVAWLDPRIKLGG